MAGVHGGAGCRRGERQSEAAPGQGPRRCQAGWAGADVRRRQVADERQAAEAGMHGSPTLLIDGVDPFGAPDQAPSLSCRLYRDEAGRPGGAPSVQALRQALAAAGLD